MTENPISLQTKADARGTLIVLETGKEVPFLIRRSYFIYGAKGASRGLHAHKKLEQVCVCVSGSCTLRLDDGKQVTEYKMNDPSKAVYIGPMVWREMHDFTEDCIFMVYASDVYDESDYIHHYEDFKRSLK